VLLLGIDTATRVGTVGVVRAPLDVSAAGAVDPDGVAARCTVLAEAVRDTGLAHGAELLSLIDECLAAAGTTLDQVEAIAVSSGPGSFTGLRVALATAKGLALGGDVALIGVPTLEALAATLLPGSGPAATPAPVAAGTLIAACLDARKGEVYAAVFAARAVADGGLVLERLTPDAAARPTAFRDSLAALLAARGPQAHAVLLGDGAERYPAEVVEALHGRASALPFARFHPRGAVVARRGAALLAESGADDRAALVPQYARASEAEILRARSDADKAPR